MSLRALEFVENWVSENVRAQTDLIQADQTQVNQTQADQPEGDNTLAKKLAARCIDAAVAAEIPAGEINEAIEDLTAFMGAQIEEANEREADRQEQDDDDDAEE